MPTPPHGTLLLAHHALLSLCCTVLSGPAPAAPALSNPALAALSESASAPAGAACADVSGRLASTLELRLDNDLFGVGKQDQGYSDGVLVTATSGALSDIEAPSAHSCHWVATRWLARRLRAIGPDQSDRQHLSVSFTHAIFTPSARSQTALIAKDRPYAAALLLGLGYNARSGARLQASRMQVGIVGPSARGKNAQNATHKVIGDGPFLGWNNQLGDEGVFQLGHERLRRHVLNDPRQREGGWRRDGISRWGVSLGNLDSHLEIGGEMRMGRRLPDDFGTSPVRPLGLHLPSGTGVSAMTPADAWNAHGFISTQVRWVLRDISLDGNTFKSSHRVHKRSIVAQVGYGMAMTYGQWQVVIARYHRTREFRGQKELPIFGSISVSHPF